MRKLREGRERRERMERKKGREGKDGKDGKERSRNSREVREEEKRGGKVRKYLKNRERWIYRESTAPQKTLNYMSVFSSTSIDGSDKFDV